MRRREFITVLGGAAAALAWPRAALAQQAPGRPLVGLLSPLAQAAAARNVAAFRQGLRDLGYVEGRNIALQLRYADGVAARLPELVAELVALKPNAIFVGSSAGIIAARQITQTIPLIMVGLEDPVSLGLAKSIARPGTNVTGTLLAGGEALVGKKLALLKDVAPAAKRVVAFINSADATDVPNARELPAAASALGLALQIIEVRTAAEFEDAFARAAREGAEALFVSQTPLFFSNHREIVAIVERLRLPAMYGWRAFAEAGGLVSYGADLPDVYRRSASFVDKILKGESPADLPFETPTRFELVVNLKTAKVMGLTISEQFLLVADEVIE